MTAPDSAPPHLTVLSTIAVKKAFTDGIIDAYTDRTGTPVNTVFEPTPVLLEKIEAGMRPDVVICTTKALNSAEHARFLDPTTITPLAQVGIGIAVSPTTPDPDISTVPAFIDTLLAARSVAYSRTGASGTYFAHLIDTLQIAEEVNSRATVINSGFTAETVMDHRADLAVQQLSELNCVPGAKIVGPIPEALQRSTAFAAALTTTAAHRSEARAFLRLLTTQQARQAYRDAGMEPL
ncbi:substrate-binding domain-containing protein [Kocuria arenosa]|uniref:substrate-binding domain-containing protein n=1 Tax=Kocuria arenosa TaxID=3071446 RepID=UPI0034D66648